MQQLSTCEPEGLCGVIMRWPPKTMRAAALWYGSIGLKIFPLWWIRKDGRCACNTDCGKNIGKHPLGKKDGAPGGHLDATADVDQIEAWWTKYPTAHIGLAMAANGLAAVDVDPRNGGNNTLAMLEEKHGPIRSTWTQTSGSGGTHIIFTADPSRDLAGGLGDGVDLKHRGYLVAAPSRHHSGGIYAWPQEQGPFYAQYDPLGGPPPVLPDWIARLPVGGASISDKAISAAIKRFWEEEPDELKAFDYEVLKLKDTEFRDLVAELSPADYSTHRFKVAGCLCREFVRHGFTAWHLRDFYAEWEGAGSYQDGQPGKGEYNDRAIVKEFENNRTRQPLTTGEAFGAVTDMPAADDDAYGRPERDAKHRLKVNVSDVAGTADQIVNVLLRRGVEIYRRGDHLVTVALREAPRELHAREGAITAQLVSLDSLAFLKLVSAHIEFLTPGKDSLREIPPPRLILDTILATVPQTPFADIIAVSGSPILRQDDTVVSARGYDPESRTFITTALDMPPSPEVPTRDDAVAAVKVLSDLIDEFPFEHETHRTAALAAIIGATTRNCYPVIPAIILSAPAPGTGKSYLADLIALVATGQRCPAMAAGRDEAETEKRLDAALLRGLPIVGIDNLNGTIGGDKLCQVIERPLIDVRPLGRSAVEQITNAFTVLGNGNNIELSIDIARRCLVCRMDAEKERPELRTFSKRPDELIQADRGRYVAACLTIVRAWRAARRTGEKAVTPRLASFEAWSDTVRSALMWLGLPDACDTMEDGRATDPGLAARQAILPAWHSLLGDASYTAAEIIDKANADAANLEGGAGFLDVLQAHLPEARRNEAGGEAKRLGVLLRGSKGLVAGGFKLEGHKTMHGVKWRVRSLR